MNLIDSDSIFIAGWNQYKIILRKMSAVITYEVNWVIPIIIHKLTAKQIFDPD